MFIFKALETLRFSELIKWKFVSMPFYAIVFAIGVQDVIIEKEHGTTYAITVTGAVDVDQLLRHVQSKLGRKVEAVTSPSKSAQSPPSQQAKKIDCEEVSDGKAAKGKEKVED